MIIKKSQLQTLDHSSNKNRAWKRSIKLSGSKIGLVSTKMRFLKQNFNNLRTNWSNMKIKQAFQIKPWLDVNKDTVNQHQMTHSSLTFTLRTSQMDASKSWELPPSTGPHWAGPHLKKGCYTTSLASVSQARPQSLTAPCQGPIYLSTIIPTHWKKNTQQ